MCIGIKTNFSVTFDHLEPYSQIHVVCTPGPVVDRHSFDLKTAESAPFLLEND